MMMRENRRGGGEPVDMKLEESTCEISGAMLQPVSVRVNSPSRLAGRMTLLAQQTEVQKQTCDAIHSDITLQNYVKHYMSKNVKRQVQGVLELHEANVNERRQRLRQLLEDEEQQLLQEMEEKKETEMERKTRMMERVQILKERKENDRQRLVSTKMDQLLRQQCEELRNIQSAMRAKQMYQERAAQLRSREEEQQRQQQEEKLFQELWEADYRTKKEHENALLQRRRWKNLETLSVLRSQMEETELRRQREKELKMEEAQLLLEKRQTEFLQKQRERELKLQEQERCRHTLDRDLRLKMKRLAREQQQEMQLDMSILQQLLDQETKEKQEVVNTKAKLWEDQQNYRRYLSEELERQKREEKEAEQLMEETLRETWMKREKQNQRQRDARRRLMDEVLEARHLQIQHKLNKNLQKQAELEKEKEELNRVVEEANKKEMEKRSWRRQRAALHQADLQAQIQYKQELHEEQRAQNRKECQQGLMLDQLCINVKDHDLSTFDSTEVHPFRRCRTVVTE